ncbi:MAG: UDP-N-acetylmuramoyl-tripeptide--D-alanyl-D-alanine ligase [Gammaproteobacteria bacterium]|nr:MAG: UDP-N-acetylmuramoyl-tripeptide--D-alanyl-D-alanine ligase [Gammaproteobacteria bacterium]
MKNLKQLAEISKGKLSGSSINIDSFSIDTRTINLNEAYIALEGENFDGHEFISEAALKGASAVIVNKPIEADIPHIIVADTLEFMKNIAEYNRNQFKGKMIGITGTNGKTTTKQIVANLLNGTNLCHKTLGNKNNQIGVPYSMLSLENKYKYSVIEMGTSEPGEIELLNARVKPDIAAITNVSMGHLEGLRNTESIAKEKGNILNFYSDSGVAILPRDSEFFDFWSDKTNAKEISSFGTDQNSDFRVANAEIDIENNLTHFHLYFENQREDMSINGIGLNNSLNAALATAIGLHCGIEINEIKNRLTQTDLPERRLSVTESLNGSLMIDDTYNSNPASLKNALDSLDKLDKKKICVLGEMKELGLDSKLIHKEMYEYASKRVDKVLCIGKSWSECDFDTNKELEIFNDQDLLYDYLVSIIDDKTVLLVKGSRSTRMDIIADKLKK